MDGRAQGALLLAVGGVAVRLGLSGAALNFIRPGYVPLLVVAGGVLLVLGAVTLRDALRDPAHHQVLADGELPHHHHDDHADANADDHADADAGDHADADQADPGHAEVQAPAPGHGHGHGHDHSRGPRVAWLLAAPLFAILLVAPPPLGSYAAARQSGVVRTAVASFPDLPPAEDGAVPLSLGDYAARALYDTERSLDGERVRLVGFASGTAEEGWTLTRFAMSCCAADGTAIDVEVLEGGPLPALDQWVEVVGTWTPRPGHEVGELTADPPMIVAESVTLVPQPTQPYET
jgi:uncharacterized repeat protein (TIGR03943 family)